MNKTKLYLALLLGFFIIFLVVNLNSVLATSCWQYTSSSGCTTATGCRWRNDSWNPAGWCEELNCWSLGSQSECISTNIPGKNCTWQGGGVNYGCEKISCWNLGTNASVCVNNSAGLNCEWSNSCYTYGSTPPGTNPPNCYEYQNSTSCSNVTGCRWGQCMDKGCGSYSTNVSCNAAKDWNGRNCTWENGYCNQNGCWKYNTNESVCTSSSGISCQWKYGNCQEADCMTWDFTNASACVNNTANLSCSWGGSYCMKRDCWNYNTPATCQAEPSCLWKTYYMSGNCQEVNCYTWDSMNSGNQTLCESNSYGLSCSWSGNPSGNKTNGWCFKNIASVSCNNKTTERECMDTFYCWWQYSNMNNQSAGGTCNTPGSPGGGTNNSIFIEWNPGCYIFDMNSSDCNNVLGCNFTGGKCAMISNHINNVSITNNGINCTMINDSRLCNNIPVLSSCCAWQNVSCVENKFSAACRDQLQQKSEDSCEDAKTYTRCSQISSSPWYMPCNWINSTSKCEFKSGDVFGNTTNSIMLIDNKMSCEAAGGKWITENYCEGNISVPVGRCENKFNEEDNCDKACFACEIKDSNGNSVNASNADSACRGSALGFCEFSANANAPNMIGFCKAKEQFKKGIAGDCDSNCGDCTYKGNANNNDTTKKPSYYCAISQANSDGGGCKWIVDNSTTTGGYCINKGDKICEDACDRCKTQSDCATKGRINMANVSGSCKWQGSSTTGSCVNNVAGDVEICWDGVDNTNDNLIDCADSSCFADSFCGFVSGDCFGWTDNNTCVAKGCEWMTDNWGSFCDFKGSQCWKLDYSSQSCSANGNCKWNNGTGNSMCEKNWTLGQVCMNLNRITCSNVSGCEWTSDTWCNETGAGTSWCNNYGGWCDYSVFKPKNCWLYSSNNACNNVSGCNWRTDQYALPHCEVNWSENCAQYSTAVICNGTSNCIWDIYQNPCSGCPSGSCMNKASKCWSYGESSCNSALNGRCYWQSWGTEGSGSCQAICWNASYNAQASCNSASSLGCVWQEQSGWCEESATCSNTTNSNSQQNCDATSGCRWKQSGWCDPKGGGFSSGGVTGGGGVASSAGVECYKYDGNQTLCTNKTIINISCGWTVNPTPKCEVDWSKDCWKYTSINNGCNATNGCWFKNDSSSSIFCTNIVEQCWQNTSLMNNLTLCAQNPYCINNSFVGCEPRCFSQNNTDCNLTFCKFPTGWCNPKAMNDMFNGMEAGAPAPLGTDNCSEGIQASVDLCGFGLKDMGDSYGIGAGVRDFSNSSVCNKEKLSSFVMGMAGGGGGGGMPAGGCTSFGTERIGNGNDTVIFVVYLDTDGSRTGGCTLDSNSSAVGYEFRFKYSSEWSKNSSKAVENFNADKCENSAWKATDIKISVWKVKMCSDIGGPMIAFKKADLAKYSSLYDSTRDIRVYISSIGNTGNVSSPSDSCGPGWTTPGSIDFEIKSVFEYGADTAKFEDILKKGFVKGEDCFNSIDDDNDGNIDCSDWDCQYSSKCSGLGVNAAGYQDTSSPQVIGVKIEEYTDSALIMYDTNKPANGTLELYGYGDTQCLNKTSEVYDIGILSDNVRDYKLWHTAAIYATNELINGKNVSISWPLNGGSSYNYKLKVCDSSGKCAISKCSSFKPASSIQKCGYCNFVTRIKPPPGWSIAYDVDRNGNYEHIQGLVCGTNTGMKTNYTIGRRVNVKLSKDDGTTYIEFLNATLTKTGLNDKVRTISSAGDIISTSSLVGLTSETRDKIINNLHPEICRIKIPVASGATCDKLYHCNDTGSNCVDRTSSAVRIDETNCIWNVPYCEFSTYKTSAPSGGDTTSTGGGGGGGGGGAGSGVTYTLTDAEFIAGTTKELAKNDQFKINVSNDIHYVKLVEFTSTTAKINVSSTTQQATLSINETKSFDVSDDGKNDLSVKLNSINLATNKTSLTVKKFVGEAEEEVEEEIKEEEETVEAKEEEKSRVWIFAVVIAVIIVVVIIIFYKVYKKT